MRQLHGIRETPARRATFDAQMNCAANAKLEDKTSFASRASDSEGIAPVVATCSTCVNRRERRDRLR